MDQKKNCDKVAAFAMFMDKRQNVAVDRIQNPEMMPPFSDNKVLSEFFFTNIYRELDPGTKYLRQQMLKQYSDLGKGQLPAVLCQIVLYRLVNKRSTFETYGNIPKHSEWKTFTNFISQELEQWCQIDKKYSKPFTAAQQINGLEKLIETMEDLDGKKDKIVKKIKQAMSLEDCFMAIKEIPYVGPFFAWQITADLMELKLIKLLDTWTELGPGAKHGLEQIFDVKSQ